MRFSDCAFVVVDCETTGFHPNAHHRVIELALVPVEGDGRVGEAWCSLINPGRDLGPTDIHGIRGRDLLDAPGFDEVLGVVIDHLAGRVVVAHNAPFDCAFLEAELTRAGVPTDELPALCTMQLAHALGSAPGRTRLADCCANLDIDVGNAHSAGDDARACARLFTAMWGDLAASGLDRLTAHGCPSAIPPSAWPSDSRRAAAKLRGARNGAATEPSFLATLIPAAHQSTRIETMAVAGYLDVLDRALEDRRLSPSEQDELGATARTLGISAEEARSIHADYLGTLIALAYRDGVVTERERADLELVSDALGLQGLNEAIAAVAKARSHVPAQRPLSGQSVCFTGALLCSLKGEPLTRDIAHLLAEEAGLTIAERVTKKLDLLVVADPDSLSGKARKARDYGVRIVAETAFWPMIGVEVE